MNQISGTAWAHVAVTWSSPDSSGASAVKAYLNRNLVSSKTGKAVPTAVRAQNFLGKANGFGKPYATNVLVGDFRWWPGTRTAEEIVESYKGTAASGARLIHYLFNDCALSSTTKSALDSSGNDRTASFADDVELTCPPAPPPPPETCSPPTITSILAATPVTIYATVAFTAGQSVTRIIIVCSASGYSTTTASARTTDVLAAGVTLSFGIEPSYGEDYTLSLTTSL
eukprot:tig00020996_g16949.t1